LVLLQMNHGRQRRRLVRRVVVVDTDARPLRHQPATSSPRGHRCGKAPSLLFTE
jgi:hypothetical protein